MPPADPVRIGERTYTILFPDLLRPLTEQERSGLEEHIRQTGAVEVPLVVDEHGGVIDGGNRLMIAAKLGLDSIPTRVKRGLTEDQKRSLAEALNEHRRHLSRDELRDRIAARLKADPEKSNRRVAEETGVDHKTVKTVRDELSSTGEIPQLTETVGADGKSRPAEKPKKKPAKPASNGDGNAESAATPEAETTSSTGQIDQLTEPAPPSDVNGNPLPAQAVEAFRAVGQFNEIGRSIDKAVADVDALAKSPAGVHLHPESVKTHLRNAKSGLLPARPTHVCPYCKGARKNCQACKGHGWVTASIHKNAPKD